MSPSKRQKARAAVALLIVNYVQKKRRIKRKRACWTQEWLKVRDVLPEESPAAEIPENYPDDFRNYLQMSDASFDWLLRAVTPLIQKKDTCMRKSISAHQRLVATLRFLATGRSLEDLKFSTAISAQALGVLIPETCCAIMQVLREEYLQLPKTPEEWKQVSQEFEDYWNFPNCGGAIGGKHVHINPPAHSGSFYLNYKGFFSVVLLAIVNAKYEFMMIDVGKNGRLSDSGVIEQTRFYRALKESKLNLPPVTETTKGLNFHFVADEAFTLHEHLLKPFPPPVLSKDRTVFNYRLSRARHVVENAFGILASRFRIFHMPINLSPEKIGIVVTACCVLHNFLRRNDTEGYAPLNMLDRENIDNGTFIPGEWRSERPRLVPLQSVEPETIESAAERNRDKYMEYFNGPGAVEWQDFIL
ncbi:uncharacterized protein LOC101731903 [Xenopus tropicalis]|uniref:Uncharacterized LOC101731903 n=1 Tax=Xenopus tropicalis TaxID=8364 RepID=A0A6I8S2J6_XENTR|nr:uncharacterized protein LOC101731903 [Xenopus tropicalis]|eukprot:XP_012825324.1 PREDICTED: uncharacterized protein LOC101731903 [Xenopus tropicalis]